MKPLVSVVMSAYNETEIELRSSIESILNQSFSDFEFIIVNDNPFNKIIADILLEYANNDVRIHILENEKNEGLVSSLNRGIIYSKGKYIARMDADDISFPNRLEIESDYLNNHPECSLVSGNKEDIDENGNNIGSKTAFNILDKNISSIMQVGTVIVHPTVMFRREAIDKVGLYRELTGCEDYDLWLRMISKNMVIHIITQPLLLKYRIRDNSVTRCNYLLQYYQVNNILALHKERIKSGTDSYSKDLNNEAIRMSKIVNKDNMFLKELFCNMASLNKVNRLIWLIKGYVFHRVLRNPIKRIIKFKVLLMKYNRRCN